MQDLVTAKELAKALGLPSTQSVWRYVRLKKIPVIRLGANQRFDVEEVRAALAREEETLDER